MTGELGCKIPSSPVGDATRTERKVRHGRVTRPVVLGFPCLVAHKREGTSRSMRRSRAPFQDRGAHRAGWVDLRHISNK
jgi:hypothetical protein